MKDGESTLVDVAIPLPVEDPFSYHVPLERMAVPPKGSRVIVPFKNREILGYVVGRPDVLKDPLMKTKAIAEWVDEEFVLDEDILDLAKRISEYYCCSWGEAISNALPQLAKKRSLVGKKRGSLDEEGELEKLDANARPAENLVLSKDQEDAFRKISLALESSRFKSFLLHGVTASGKTEVYVRTIETCLKQGRSAIVLVPEIALTVPVKNYFRARFGNEVVVLHSQMTPRERYDGWSGIREGKSRIVLGPRSAVFAPLKRIGLIVIDEEQEDTYKQEESPRYHAGQVARWRAEAENAVLIYGSATPSLSTRYAAEQGRIEKLVLGERVTTHSLPNIQVVDIRGEKNPLCSRVLERAIEVALTQKEGVLLFLNRRGFSTQLRCTKCQNIAMCRFCHVALTFHQEAGAAVCHYCNFRWTKLTECPGCGGRGLQYLGFGSEKVESEFARKFPKARIARLDSDVARKKGKAEEILKAFAQNEIDILVGTQMITKGHNFPRITLVGVLLADLALALPDYRSSERNFQILVQVAGRAGRGEKPGQVIIQTYSPDHYSVKAAAKQDYEAFYQSEIESRKRAGYPPFSHLINIIVRGVHGARVEKYSLALRMVLEHRSGDYFSIIGPAPCPIPKLRGHYRWHIILKGNDMKNMNKSLREAMAEARRPGSIMTAIDVDPVNIL